MKYKFPEYTEKAIRQEKKQAEKAKKAEEKAKNKLPPFLLVRSGLFDKTAIAALLVVPASAYFLQYDNNVFADFAAFCMWIFMMVIFLIDNLCMNSEKKRIKSDIEDYIYNLDAHWQPIASYEYKRLAENIIKWKAKNDKQLFNRFINYPNEIHDERSAVAIIQGHLKSHPKDANKILEKFDTKTLPSKVLKLIKHCK